MQRKTLLSACIALALSGQGWAADITEIETTTGEKKNTNVTCPADPGKLSPEELKRLPSECSSVVEQNLMPWLVTGAATALITTLAIVELNDDDDHHRNNSPLPPTPPDDDSDDTPVPPTPGGDEIIPDDGPDDTPTPPKPIAFNNDVILDKTEKTLTIRDSVFSYTENADGTISLQDSNGRKATINLWQIDETNNTVALEGMSADGATKWQYNHNGELVITGDNTTVNNTGKTIVDGKGATGTEIAGNNAVVNQDGELDVSGGGHGIDITGDSATVDNKGGMTVTDPDSIGIQIDGDKAVVNKDGDSAISNGGTGTQVNGDEATVNNNGSTTVDGKDSTGTEINGDKAIVNNDGDSTILDGGTGTRITGDDATANNSGNTTVDGQGSTGTEIAGNNAVVNQDGELDVSGGGHGIDITGDSATVDNKGGMTVTDPDSIGIQIDGDKAVVNNDGGSAISNGGTGTQINGDEATVNNNGNTTVDGQGSTGTEIAGNNAVVNQDGELDVSGGGHGIDITGDSATVDNKGGMTVTDPDSIGIQIDGDKAVVNNDGDSAISNGGTGTQVNGDEATVNNNGKTTVDGKDSTGTEINGDKAIVNNDGDSTILDGGTGTRITGDDATANNSGNTTVDGQGSTGTEIAGNNAVVNQDGELDVSGGGHGIDITGDSATVDNKGGMTVTDPDSIGIQIDGDKAVVNNDGDNAISNGGTGTQVNGDEATVNNNGNTTVDGKDSTGTEINGDKAIVNNDGDSTILDGGTGTRITGDDATANNSGNTTVDGQGSTGTEIAGNNAVVNQDGELDVSGGGHGIDITGDSATVDNKGGMTVTDPDSIGIQIDGDKAVVNNDGDSAISNGGTGTQVNGDEATVNNNGNTTVDGKDSTGTEINGDKAIVNNDGDSTILDGGTGTRITGDDATANNSGNTTVDGQGSTGTEIAGNNAVVNQDGLLDVSGGGHGIDITGDSATVINKGNITVTDKDSVGVLINGDRATFANTGHIDVNNSATGMSITTSEGAISQAGSMNVGDFSTGMALSGNNNSVTLAAKDLNVIGQKATGVNISGDNNAVDITGNILVDKDQTATNAVDYFYEPSIGVNVSGNSNTVSLDGKLTVVADSELTSRIYADFDGSQENISGLVVSGDDNTVYLNGGIQLVGEENQLTDGSTVASNRNGYGKTPVITVDGKSSVYLNGDSTINGDLPLAYSGMIRLKNSAMIEIGADATINMQVDIYDHYARSESQMIFVESGAELVNKGDIDTRNIGFAAISGENSTGSNSGNITLSQYNYGLLANAGVGYFTTKGGSAVNNGTITAKVMEQESVINLGASLGLNEANTFYSDANSMMGLDAFDHGYVSNESGGSIEMYGRGNVGMLAIDESTAENAGQITLDALWVDADDTTTLRSNIGNDARSYGVGMAVGTNTYSGPRKNATAVNKQGGVITVYNAGIGMAAYGASNTVINEGIINLEKNANYDSSLGADSLIGMAAYKSGTAINEQSGVININADNGQAFYSDGSGTILNYGTICVNTNCLTGNDYNETDSYTSLLYTGGDVITAQNETQNLTQKASINDKKEGNVVNSGSLSGADIAISSGELVNTSTGTINNAIIINDGELSNEGSVAKVTLNAGTFGNTGTVNSRMFQTGGTFNNQQGGVVQNGANLSKTAITNNEGTWYLGASSSSDSNNASMMEIYNTAVFNNSGDFILNNSRNAIHLYQSGSFYNTGHMLISGANYSGNAINYWNANNNGRFINSGTVDVTAKALATSGVDASTNHAYFWNQNSGIVNFDKDSGVAVKFTHSNYVAQNDGTMNISGNNAIAMEGNKNAQLINNGTINLGAQGTTDTGMIGMQLDSSATADAVIENNGTINIYANNSFAFSMLGSVGHLVNNGTVTIADGVTGSGLIKQGNSVNIEGVNGNNGNNSEVHYANYTLPDVPGSSVFVSTDNVSDNGGQNNLNGYVVGTSSDGSAGKLKVSNASLKGVSVNTGFTSGTSATSVTFDNVVQGNNLTDADTITSTSVVWSAQGNTDANGNVDVTMTKNAYTDVVTDSSVNNVAQVLDTGYTNNDLYTSLNVGTTAELNSALKQISGSQATTVFNEARVLSNRFSMLSDAAPEVANGLAFNVVAKGDPRAELGNDTQYDMMALRKSLTLTEHQNLSLEYGIARLEGNGSDTAGDNGVTGGYSQLFGLKHQMAFDNGMNWNNALRYDVHQLDSSRSIAYGDVNKTADANVKQQYLEFRSEGAKTFELREGLNVTPYAGVKLRHTLEGGYQERNAGDFNLSMNSGSETAVDSIVGLKLDYAGKEGWSANATLEGGPNLSYVKSQRTASISGAGSQRFNIDDGQSGGGFNSLATMGVKYSSQESALQVDAFHWKEDGISDKGVMLNFKKTF
ncbi:TPA: EntS/YbdA MFS transporter [Escherichia coli]|uniref:BigA/YdbA N-terminal beta-barrel domain-containing protein n=1 Tax=Escherichia coli TaxID=562 RepID=UPI0018125C01|nr:EntS/YbdA MFS transporter [Escherichia coli]EFO4551989.1 EntS/YbdA MFS transporter [Escherichia coli]ELH8612519.1 EntS/YbdA MFS transporter [Escherichia coli]ELK4531208.1 EntS/YbdA MFS transporter [Escherichia coli]